MFKLPSLPDDLPWRMPAYLLLDGVSVPSLKQRLLRWDNPKHCLYQGTRWHELSDISPYLIALQGAGDSLLAYFQENAALEWGYLLFSTADASAVCRHWRRLLSVADPSGSKVMPRIADPAVIDRLLGLAQHARTARWFGPVDHVCLPDSVQGCWQQRARPAHVAPDPGDTYRLTDEEFTALGDVEFRRSVLALSNHMHRYFPAFMAAFPAHERLHQVQQMAQTAYARGFTSEREITLYANILGYLAGQSLTAHADIEVLLKVPAVPTAQFPLSRLERAAELARSRAVASQGSRS